MRSISTFILSLILTTSLFSDSLQQGQKQLPPSQTPPPAPQSSQVKQAPQAPAVEEDEEDDTGEIDEDIIIQDEEGTDEDEGVHN